MNDHDQQFVSALRAAAPYVHAHRGKVVVIAISGEAVAADGFERLIYDIALLHSLGLRLVLVHGARPQIERALKQAGIAPQIVGDRRVTDLASLDCVKAAVGSLRLEIEARLSTSLASTPMGGARLKAVSGNWITARPLGVRNGVDHQHTGEVRRVDAMSLRANLDAERIALVSPIGYSPTGEIFNLRAEEVATAVATALAADKLIFLTASNPRQWPVADDAGDVGQLELSAATALLDDHNHPLQDSDRHYLEAAVAALRGGVGRAHMLDCNADGALLRELFSRDGLVIACGALFHFPDSHCAELACIAVHPDYRRAGRAERLLGHIEAAARALAVQQLFTLTTHTPHWFIEHGFAKASIDALPMQKRELYNYQRGSLVLQKSL